MFGWLRKRRDIFRYHDGRRWRYVDPVRIAYAFESHPEFDEERHLAEMENGSHEALEITAAACRDVFGIQDLDAEGRGLSVLEQVAVLTAFYVFCERLKKKLKTLPIAPASTGSISSESSGPTTGDMSGSGSISPEPSNGKQGSPEPAPTQPSSMSGME